jgi:hypothetical protein
MFTRSDLRRTFRKSFQSAAKLTEFVEELISEHRDQLEALKDSVDWDSLPRELQLYVDVLADDIDAFVKLVDPELEQLEAKFERAQEDLLSEIQMEGFEDSVRSESAV